MDSLSVKLLPEEHLLLREIKKADLLGRPFFIGVSGGVDSVVCAYMLSRLRPLLKSDLFLIHIHHGVGTHQQKKYRDKARLFTQKLAERLQIPFLTNVSMPKKKLKSEEELRDFRLDEIEKLIKPYQSKNPVLVLAHHKDDLLETQMLRLVRGTGHEGLRAMSFSNEKVLRPLILFSKKEILNYAKKIKLKWLDDPSNTKPDALRNWMRQTWLKSLEKRSPGSLASLSRSLQLLVSEYESIHNHHTDFTPGISRSEYLSLGRQGKMQLLAKYLKFLGAFKYTQGHLEEIAKRLDNSQEEFRFSLLKHEWLINAEQIKALKSHSTSKQ